MVVMECRMCGEKIPTERLDRWSWAVTCSTDCSMANEVASSRRHRREYRRRRRRKAKDKG